MTPLSPDPFQHEMILIPAGSFEMGDIWGEGSYAEQPVHHVKLADYYLSRCPVTQAQRVTLMGKTLAGINPPLNCPWWR